MEQTSHEQYNLIFRFREENAYVRKHPQGVAVVQGQKGFLYDPEAIRSGVVKSDELEAEFKFSESVRIKVLEAMQQIAADF